MKRHKSITVMVPAYNEENNLARAINRYDKAVKAVFNDYEFIIFNDCSLDRTGKIADELTKKNKKIRSIHNNQNMGIGYNYRAGIELSQKEYYMMLTGEGEILSSSIKEILSHSGEADILISYIGNPKVRPPYRTIISRGFTILLNMLFGLHIKYYNGNVIHKTELLKKVKMNTNNAAYQAEVLIKMLKKGYSYKEVPIYIEETKGSELFRLRNLIDVFLTISKLFFDINFKKHSQK